MFLAKGPPEILEVPHFAIVEWSARGWRLWRSAGPQVTFQWYRRAPAKHQIEAARASGLIERLMGSWYRPIAPAVHAVWQGQTAAAAAVAAVVAAAAERYWMLETPSAVMAQTLAGHGQTQLAAHCAAGRPLLAGPVLGLVPWANFRSAAG